MRDSAMAAAGLSSAFASAEAVSGQDAEKKPQQPKLPQVPRRKLGKTGIDVPCLALGTMFNLVDSQIVLRNTIKWGVKYWDTAYGYAGGNSELGIGKYLLKNPEVRKELFIATKASGARTVADVEKRLQSSLKRLNTKYIDLYYAPHAASDPGQLTNELKQWAESAKKRKLIRYFGFTTHKNTANCLAAAARLDWIDAIMTSYNFRLMQDSKLLDAIEACHKAGIAIIAMKTTGRTTIIMRYLMYYNSYGDRNRARELFAQIPVMVRGRLLSLDYRLAEARCPQHLPIGRLVAEAVSKLA